MRSGAARTLASYIRITTRVAGEGLVCSEDVITSECAANVEQHHRVKKKGASFELAQTAFITRVLRPLPPTCSGVTGWAGMISWVGTHGTGAGRVHADTGV